MSIYNQVLWGTRTLLASAVRSATQAIVGQDIIDPAVNGNRSGINAEISGAVFYLNVTAVPGVDTVQLVLEEQDPTSGVWSQVAATTATAVTGMVRMKIKPAIAGVAASTTGVQVQDIMPAIWRVRVVHSGAGNFTYSLGFAGYC